jgi:hypothetical protein
MTNGRGSGPKVFVPLFIGAMGLAALTNEAGSPGFAAFRTIDVVRLLASGMCLGAAVAALGIFFLGSRSR